MKCEKAKNLIPLHAGNDLANDRDEQALEDHLSNCSDCSERLEEYRDVRQTLSAFVPEESDRAYWEDFNRELDVRLKVETPGLERDVSGWAAQNEGCERAEQLIPLYAGRDLENASDVSFLRSHLEDCSSCSNLLSEHQEARDVLSHLKPDEADDSYWDDFNRELEARLRVEPGPGEEHGKKTDDSGSTTVASSRFAQAAAVLLVTVIAGLGGWYVFSGSGVTNQGESPEPTVENDRTEKDGSVEQAGTIEEREKGENEVTEGELDENKIAEKGEEGEEKGSEKNTPERRKVKKISKKAVGTDTDMISEEYKQQLKKLSSHSIREFSVPSNEETTFSLGQGRSMNWAQDRSDRGPGQEASVDF